VLRWGICNIIIIIIIIYYYYYYYYYYLLTSIGLMPGGSVYKGYTVNKEHSTPVSRKDDNINIYQYKCKRK
jgi:hypothetical protein